jgi:hypothetical protein
VSAVLTVIAVPSTVGVVHPMSIVSHPEAATHYLEHARAQLPLLQAQPFRLAKAALMDRVVDLMVTVAWVVMMVIAVRDTAGVVRLAPTAAQDARVYSGCVIKSGYKLQGALNK